jgi:PemK-like, MazF-like toxin of type II toxin-antitoxin system
MVNFDPTIGAEAKETRPGLVVSNDINNTHSPIISIAPITSNVTRVYSFEVDVAAQETVSITVSLGPADVVHQTAEWWLAAETEEGLFYYVHPSGWQTGFQRAFVGPVGPVTSFEVYRGMLPPGRTIIYFALDPIVDDSPQITWLDLVVVDVR